MLNTVQMKKYNLGVIAPRTTKLEHVSDLLTPKKDSIGHIYTNNVLTGGQYVMDVSCVLGIPFTVYPVKHIAGGILPSNQHIIHHSDFIYILDDGESGNVVLAQRECEKQGKKFKIIKL